MSQRLCGVKYGSAMKDDVPSPERRAVAPNAGSSSSTTWSRSLKAGKRRSQICSSAAGLTIRYEADVRSKPSITDQESETFDLTSG